MNTLETVNQKIDNEIERIYSENPKQKSKEAFLMSLSAKDRRFMVICWWEMQVSNGGIMQWLDNGYGEHSDFLFDALRDLGTENAKKVKKMAKRALEMDMDELQEYEGPEFNELDELDDQYYEFSGELMGELAEKL